MRDALSRHASHAATTRCETLVFDRIAAPSTCRRCGARPLRADLATTFAATHRQPSRGRGKDTRENPHARRKAACDKALRHALKIGRACCGLACHRATRRHRSASRHRSTPSRRAQRRAHRRRRQTSRHGGTHRASTSPRASSRSVRARRASDAPTQRFALRERDIDASSTRDRRSIDARSTLDDDRRVRSATQWTGRSVSRSAPRSASRFLAVDHAIGPRHRPRDRPAIDDPRRPSMVP